MSFKDNNTPLPPSTEEEEPGFLSNLYDTIVSANDGLAQARERNKGKTVLDLEREGRKIINDQQLQKKEDVLNEDNLAETVFQEQCVLLENFETLARFNFPHIYSNFVSVHGATGQLTNLMHSRKNISPFWDITPEQLSHLQPTVRLFKVRYDRDGQEIDAVEMPFAEKVDEKDLESITNTKASRGSGVNLVNIDWKLQGSNPAEATNIIECSFTLRFESLQDLLKERDTYDKNGNLVKVAFAELLMPEKKVIKEEADNGRIITTKYNPNYFTFRVILGWADLTGATDGRKDLKELNRVLQEDQRVFSLTMTNHDIDFSQEGPVKIVVHANARIDVVSYLQESDIYYRHRKNFDEAFAKYTEEKDKNDFKESNCKVTKKTETQEEQERKERDIVKHLLDTAQIEKTIMWSKLLRDMITKDRVFSITIDASLVNAQYDREYYQALLAARNENSEVINRQLMASARSQQHLAAWINFTDIKPYQGEIFTQVGVDVVKAEEDLLEAQKKNTQNFVRNNFSGKDSTYTIPFIYLGDVLDVALEALNPKNNKYITDSNKTIIGDIVLYDPRTFKRYSVNMADLPISISLFKEWFLHQVYGNKKGEVYPVKVFLRDVIEQLLPSMLNPDGCFVEVPQRAIKMSTTHLTTSKKDGQDPIFSSTCRRTLLNSLLELSKPKKPLGEEIIEYYIIYAAESFPPGQIADYQKDLENGIYHFYLGRDKGLIKAINFSRADMPYMRESRIISEGDSQFGRLREFYTAQIDMLGNNLFIPGDAIFINPSTIVLGSNYRGETLGQIMGLTGYYRVVNVGSFIESGEYRTSINAIWEAAGDGKSRSVTDQNSALKNKLCGNVDTPQVKDTITLREIYSREDIQIVSPGTNENYCLEVAQLGSEKRAEAQRRASSGGYVPR